MASLRGICDPVRRGGVARAARAAHRHHPGWRAPAPRPRASLRPWRASPPSHAPACGRKGAGTGLPGRGGVLYVFGWSRDVFWILAGGGVQGRVFGTCRLRASRNQTERGILAPRGHLRCSPRGAGLPGGRARPAPQERRGPGAGMNPGGRGLAARPGPTNPGPGVPPGTAAARIYPWISRGCHGIPPTGPAATRPRLASPACGRRSQPTGLLGRYSGIAISRGLSLAPLCVGGPVAGCCECVRVSGVTTHWRPAGRLPRLGERRLRRWGVWPAEERPST